MIAINILFLDSDDNFLFLLKKYFNDLYKNKFFQNDLYNIKDIILENKIDIIAIDINLIENIIIFFSEINSLKRKISVILISSNNISNFDIGNYKYLEIKKLNKPFLFTNLKSQIDKFNNSNKKNDFQDLNLKISNYEKTEKNEINL